MSQPADLYEDDDYTLLRTSSLPSNLYDYDDSILLRTSTLPFKRKRVGMSTTVRDEKIAEFESYINRNLGITEEEVNEGDEAVDEALTQDDSGRKAKFFYFIGRLNPPHNGHLKALETLVSMANKVGSTPLILLGSGPGSERTMDNPISFDFKEHFIRRVLNEKLPNSTFTIKKMTNPARDVSEYIKEGLGENLDNIKNIEIKHIAGGKDEDTSKLLFALKSAEKTARETASGAEIITEVQPIAPATIEGDTAMSATKVRKDAYQSVLDGSGFDSWNEKYGVFYGEDAREMYRQILYPLESKSQEEQIEMVNNYLNPIPKSVGQKKKRGGTKKKQKKLKKKTQKRRRRITRRRH